MPARPVRGDGPIGAGLRSLSWLDRPSHAGRVVLTRLRTDELAYTWVDDGAGAPLQFALLAVFDRGPFQHPDGTVAVGQIREQLARRAHRVALLARRVVWTRWGEGRPVWADDPNYDPREHITVDRVPAGADLYDWAAMHAARPVDRDRPLWRAEVVHGLPDGQFAVLIVVSHVLVDGRAGVALASSLFDPAPDVSLEISPSDAVALSPGLRLPTHRQLATEHRREFATALRRRWSSRGCTVSRIDKRPRMREVRAALAGFSGREPRTSLPRRAGAGRRLAVASLSLGEVKAIARILDVTVNDVLLAVVTGGLRYLLRALDDAVPAHLRCSVPATVGPPGRQVLSMLLISLPVGDPNPLRRLALIHRATTTAKAQLRGGGHDLTDLHLPTWLARWFLRTSRRLGSRRLTLSVSNVPGPAAPLWLAGARMRTAVPVAPLSPLVPLSLAALSYDGQFVVTVNADASLHNLEAFVDGAARCFAELTDLAQQPVLTGQPDSRLIAGCWWQEPAAATLPEVRHDENRG